MSHILLKLSFLSAVCLTFVVLLFHTRDFDDLNLHVLLTPPADCSAPCFLGVQVGVTTLASGLEELRANPIIQSVSLLESYPDAPVSNNLYDVAFINTFAPIRRARLELSTEARVGTIEGVYLFDSDIRLSDILLIFGQPTRLVLDDRNHLGLVTYAAFYPAYQMYVQAILPLCSPNPEPSWDMQQNVLIGVESEQKYAERRSYYPAGIGENFQGWANRVEGLRRIDCTSP